MAGQSPRHVEILVHVAAPSTAADDGRYRGLARAYLAFEPAARTALPAAPDDPSSSARLRQSSDGPGALGDPPQTRSRGAPPAFSSAPEQHGVFCAPESQDLSFQSAWDNRSSPRLRPLVRPGPPPTSAARAPLSSQGDDGRAPSPSPFRAPASQISDSYPLPDAGVFTVTPTRILQRYLSNNNARGSTGTPTSAASSPPSQALGPDADVIDVPSSLPVPSRQYEPPPPPKAPSQQQHGSPAGHVIPVTPLALPALPPRSKRTAEELATSALLDLTHISSSFVSHQSASSPSRAESEPPPLPPCKKPKVTEDGGGDSLVLVRSTSDAGPIMAMANCAAAAAADDDDALEIRPPSPPADTAHIDPTTLVSDKLAKLARDLASRYRPEPPRRALEPLERGYWLLDCSGWPPQTCRETWVFLTNYLRSGLAGWGVWCRRGSPASQQQQRHAWIRLYCWACVAKHTYLLLYLASGRHVKATGAAWYGADGLVALEVAPSGGRRP
ncbi:hypothetical protein HRG_011576 [Hirsutella rhossiliensis]|uniref:Uncharacterized protein n=1 Tax=Hirsutella rhossiliensis TaxID=111463 RepID=A0A9P8MLW7_9HYPO|nr:uncharacterized protein HRG_11576 [Hirsutella rhossiliensis]KAH0957429.1 hypothetical protein HRG_11576 [Hirsutella rhossiliensis]